MLFWRKIFCKKISCFENIVAYRYAINIIEYSSVNSFQYRQQKFIDKKTPLGLGSFLG